MGAFVSQCSATLASLRFRFPLCIELLQGPYQVDGDNFAIRLLDLPQLHQKVPES